LLLAAASGYVFYTYASVSSEAERVSHSDIDAARELRDRARNLFLRANDYAAQALALDYPELQAALMLAPETAVATIESRSNRTIELLYWNAASLGLAISSARNDPALIARSGEVEAMLGRALELDPTWDEGSLHEFAISAASLTGIDRDEIDTHFEEALELSAGKRAGLFVTYAEATAIQNQNRSAFVELLERALAVPVDDYPELTLINTVAQRRATWLLGQLDMLFLE
jgi:predicted anti-sigma-YlaC factor YlaD